MGNQGIWGEKPLGAKPRTKNILNPHDADSRNHIWVTLVGASAFTTIQSLLLKVWVSLKGTNGHWFVNVQLESCFTWNIKPWLISLKLLLFIFSSSHHVLDVGSGLGGPARHIAHTTDCTVTALELQEDLHKEAENLTRRCNLQQKLNHITGDFLQLDFGMFIQLIG